MGSNLSDALTSFQRKIDNKDNKYKDALYKLLLFTSSSFLFWSVPHSMWDPSSPTRDWTCAPMQWKARVLTTEQPEKSQNDSNLYI